MSGINEIREEYTSSLQDLTFNSKPLISVLTILAEENVAHAKEIVGAIESHLTRVRIEVKLPVLYLIDCIIKNVDGPYTALFCQNLVSTFCNVFEQVDERTRAEMFRLRQTWNDVIPPKKLYALDIQITQLDPAWPVTAPPPSIHFNPKFLKTTNASASGTVTAPVNSKSAKNSLTNTSSVDTKALSMQQKLINKQKELLELQQRKLQLELLQTQVKLQEQQLLHNTNPGKTAASQINVPHSQNLLLKPEVAKQMSSIKNKPPPSNMKSGSKIAPVNSNLANARPIRDPRLLRQQQQQQQAQQALSNVNANVHLESKSKSGTQVTVDSDNNKIVNSKTSVRNDHIEHRLVNNKGNIDSHGKSKTSPHSSPLKHTQKIGSSFRKMSKFTRDSKATNSTDMSDGKNSNVDRAGRGELSKPRTFTRSFLKTKKKSGERLAGGAVSPSNSSGSLRNDKDSVVTKKSDKHLFKSSKSDKEKFKSDGSFKDPKGSLKSRNYIRRNRNTSVSPEPTQDVEGHGRAPPEKQPRLQGDNIDDTNGNNGPAVDIDLRQLPSTITKKRPSTENQESSTAKKSRSEMFDVLFGSEDTDLRQLPPPVLSLPILTDRPPTPPPPIISDKHEQVGEAKTDPVETAPLKRPNLDALRAKLANAVNMNNLKDRAEMDGFSKRLQTKNSDMDQMSQIIISAAEEQSIIADNLTAAQKNALIHKIIAQIETNKLREAHRRESENTHNISLQPISDDEPNFSGSGSDEEGRKGGSRRQREDSNRTSPIPPQVSQLEGTYPPYTRQPEQRDPRRTRQWRGRHRKVWDYPPSVVRARSSYRDDWLRPMNEAWRSMSPQQPPFPGDQPGPQLKDHGTQSPNSQELPTLEYAHPDSYKFITIDSEPREIRYYDETAIVFMNSSDPREITFHNGTRRIFFDGEPFLLKLNSPYEEISLKGNVHQVRLGAPSREIFIDGNGYECYFDNNEKVIDLDGNKIFVKLEPPPPQVKIGQVKRLDLVAGKVQLVVDAKNMYTIFLDAKLQTFELNGEKHTLKLVDSLRAALINDVRFEIEYGGLPKPIMLRDKKRFIRFSVLPDGIKPGFVHIKDMENTQESESVENEARQDDVRSPLPSENVQDVLRNKPTRFDGNSPEHNSNSPHHFHHHPNINNLDMLSSMIASSMIPSSTDGGYQVEDTNSQDIQSTRTVPTNAPEIKNAPSLNVSELFQRLVATGIVTTAPTAPPPVVEETRPPPSPPRPVRTTHFPKNYKPPTFSKPESLKTRRVPVMQVLYMGMQCSSCGMRFPADQSIYYSQHLDWHFRQNRRGKKNIRKAASRRWYYTMSDWRNYEEIEDLEEREKNYFENQQNPDGANDDAEEEIEIPCVPADPNTQDAACEVCRDKFEQFYNEEKDEWQLRMAIRMDDKTYHPLCYEDYQASLVDPSLEELKLNVGEEENDANIPGLGEEESAIDDVMEVIENIDDEEPPPPVIEEPSPPPNVADISIDDDEEDGDDDVILNEVVPERIIVDDDDKDDYVSGDGLIPGVVVKVEPVDDGFVDVEGGLVRTKEVKVKPEGAAATDVRTVVPGLEIVPEVVDTTHTEVVSTIDGNVEFESGVNTSTGISGKIKINITKPIPAIVTKETKETVTEQLTTVDCIDPSQPLPPGEEPVQLNVKPALQGLELKRQAMVRKGSELTGLCSIM